MILDSNLNFSSAQAITNSAASSTVTAYDESGGNTNIGNVSRFGADFGVGQGKVHPKIVVGISTTFTTTNSATLNIQFQGSTDSSSWTTYVETGALAAAVLTSGSVVELEWPRKALGAAMPRYVRLYYTVGTGVFSAGAVNGNVAITPDGWVGVADQYPSNYTVGA